MAFPRHWFGQGEPVSGKHAAVAGHAIVLIERQAGEKPDLLLSTRRPTGKESKQPLERIRSNDAVGIEDPNPIVVVLERKAKTTMNGSACPEIRRVAQDRGIFERRLLESTVGGSVVDDQDSVYGMGLVPHRLDRPINDAGIIERVNMGQNAHRS